MSSSWSRWRVFLRLRSSFGLNFPRKFCQVFQKSLGIFKIEDMSKIVYCPVCKFKRKLSFFNGRGPYIGLVIVFTMIGFAAHWLWMVLGGFLAMTGEFLFRITRRALLVCPRCDYDPYLYVKDIPKARARVEAKLKTLYPSKDPPQQQL